MTTVVSGGKKNASTTILYGTVGGATTSAPGKTAVSNTNKQNKHGNYPKDGANGIDSIWLGGVGYYRDNSYCIQGLTTTLLNGAFDVTLKLGYYYTNGPRYNQMKTQYGNKILSVDGITGTVTSSGVTDTFARDDAFSKSHGGEFVFIPAGKLPSQNAGNSKYYTYSAKTNG